MQKFLNNVGLLVPEVMLPDANADFSKWAVVACDQYTSQPEYWQKAREYIKDAPSTLDLMLPEAFLDKPDEAQRIEAIRNNMRRYMDEGILKPRKQGFVLVKRSVAGNTRLGLVVALDLECYDYSKGSTMLIRASEGTIVERIPPRLRIRKGAPIELPHILVLIDDPKRSVIEPLMDKACELEKLYDTDLMLDGGHITGWLVSDDELIQGVIDALGVIASPEVFSAKYGDKAPLLYAMGDGNHSFATAKANWEQIKTTLTPKQRENHPARWALVELENVHDEGIIFEPIHRVVFGMDGAKAIKNLTAILNEQNGGVSVTETRKLSAPEGGASHKLPFVYKGHTGVIEVASPRQQLAVGTLQAAIDMLIRENSGVSVDYIHGADVVERLASEDKAVGFTLPAMEKSEFFDTVVYDGALPRKTFSMGEANEKRYYMECRLIEP